MSERGAGTAVAALALLVAAAGAAQAEEPHHDGAASGPKPPAHAEPRALDPEVVSGVIRPVREPGDGLRDAANVLLFIPRKTVEYLFLATGMAAGLVRDEQVVPRVEELVDPRPGDVTVFPTLFLDTRRAPSIGGRMLASGVDAATSLAAGFGGPDDVNAEARIRVGWPKPLPFVVSLEAFYDIRSRLEYLGVGQDPNLDRRNHYRPGAPHAATYLERRTRFIGSIGVRPAKDVEVFISTGITRSQVEDALDAGPSTLTRVFEPGSVPGAPLVTQVGAMAETRIVYTEIAARLDTRPTLGRPSPGVLIEGYAGPGIGVRGDPTQFLRYGGRVAAFLPILRSTNILSPKLTIDAMVPLDTAPIPFTALVGQPDFRSVDSRRDLVSAILSIDYRWVFSRFIGARVFSDLATVGPSFERLFEADPRPAVGVGVDLFSPSTEIGSFAFAYGFEGPSVLLSFGTVQGFGDRQHRY